MTFAIKISSDNTYALLNILEFWLPTSEFEFWYLNVGRKQMEILGQYQFWNKFDFTMNCPACNASCGGYKAVSL